MEDKTLEKDYLEYVINGINCRSHFFETWYKFSNGYGLIAGKAMYRIGTIWEEDKLEVALVKYDESDRGFRIIYKDDEYINDNPYFNENDLSETLAKIKNIDVDKKLT